MLWYFFPALTLLGYILIRNPQTSPSFAKATVTSNLFGPPSTERLTSTKEKESLLLLTNGFCLLRVWVILDHYKILKYSHSNFQAPTFSRKRIWFSNERPRDALHSTCVSSLQTARSNFGSGFQIIGPVVAIGKIACLVSKEILWSLIGVFQVWSFFLSLYSLV